MSQAETAVEELDSLTPAVEEVTEEVVEEVTAQSILAQKIRPVSEAPPHAKVFVYGEPGTGKTILAARSPNPLIVDTEHGTRSLLNHPELSAIPVLRVTSFNELDDLFWELKEGFMPDRETIVIDSISELQKRHLDETLIKAADKDPNRNAFLPYQQDYKYNTEVMRRLIVSFRDLERNLVITAGVIEDKDEGDGHIFKRPAVTPKLAGTLEAIFDVLGYMSLEFGANNQIKRYLQVFPSHRVRAKTRIGGLPTVIENPTFNMLLDAVIKHDEKGV